MFVDFFIRRPILSTVCRSSSSWRARSSIPDAADRAVPAAGAAAGERDRGLHRRERADRRVGGHHPARAGHQRRRGHALHDVDEHQQRRQHDHGHLRRRTATRTWPPSTCRTASSTDARTPAERGQEHRRHRHEGLDRLRAWPSASTRSTASTTRCSSATTSTSSCADALKRVPGVADVIIFGERKYAMRLWLDPTRLASRGLDGGRRDAARCASRTCRLRPAPSASRRREPASPTRSACAPPAG